MKSAKSQKAARASVPRMSGRSLHGLRRTSGSNTHSIDVGGSAVIAEVDAPKVERVIENRLANAVTHTPAGTKISLSVEPHDSGIPPENDSESSPRGRSAKSPFGLG